MFYSSFSQNLKSHLYPWVQVILPIIGHQYVGSRVNDSFKRCIVLDITVVMPVIFTISNWEMIHKASSGQRYRNRSVQSRWNDFPRPHPGLLKKPEAPQVWEERLVSLLIRTLLPTCGCAPPASPTSLPKSPAWLLGWGLWAGRSNAPMAFLRPTLGTHVGLQPGSKEVSLPLFYRTADIDVRAFLTPWRCGMCLL